MNKTFVISDTHFGHKNILTFESSFRPFSSIEEHDAELVRRWNSVVGPKDTVIHLGDAVFGKHNLPILGQLNGLKQLVKGNHDNYKIDDYLQFFTKVHGVLVRNDVVMTHIPVHPCQFGRFRLNIHGHLHHEKLDNDRYINVSCEHINCTPVLLSELVQ